MRAGRITICHRPESEAAASRLQRSLARELPGALFAGPAGVDFESTPEDPCDVLIVVIDSHWTGARLFEHGDAVREQIERALQCGARVLPLLLGDAQLPTEPSLPESIRALVKRQTRRLRSGEEYAYGVRALAASLRPRRDLRSLALIGIVGLGLIGLAAAFAPRDAPVDTEVRTLAPVVVRTEPRAARDAGGPRSPAPTVPARAPATTPKVTTAKRADHWCDLRCKVDGLCFDDGGTCVARSDAGCRASSACRRLGACVSREDRCVAGSDADCRAASTCKSHGTCVLRDQRCAVGSDADCAASTELCKRLGQCTAYFGECVATRDADCRAATVCATSLKCRAERGTCVDAPTSRR